MIYSELSVSAGVRTHILHTHPFNTGASAGAVGKGASREPPFLSLSSQLSSSLIILHSFLPSVSLASFSYHALFLSPSTTPPTPIFLPSLLFPLTDHIPLSWAKTSQYDTKTNPTHILHIQYIERSKVHVDKCDYMNELKHLQ